MNTDKAILAQELLDLEKEYQNAGLDGPKSERWNQLVPQLFGEENADHKRRSFRIPGNVPATVKIRAGTFPCEIQEVSRIGLMLQGQVFRFITHEDTVELLKFTFDKEEQPLNLTCSIARLEGSGDAAKAGLQIASHNPSEARERFFDRVYYPLYIQYLKYLAGKKNS